jgi:hypothetical protein
MSTLESLKKIESSARGSVPCPQAVKFCHNLEKEMGQTDCTEYDVTVVT